MNQTSRVSLQDQWIHRLVDGELQSSQLREMIELLDAHPTEWRRCALLLLENQSLARECAAMARSAPLAISTRGADHAQLVGQPVGRREPSRARSQRTWEFLAVAALLLLMFSAGYALRGPVVPSDDSPTIAVDHAPPSATIEPHHESVEAAPRNEPYASDQPTYYVNQNSGNELGVNQVGSVQVKIDNETVTELPVYDESTMPSLYASSEAAFSPALIEQLQQQGKRVRRHVTFMPVTLSDGRSAVVPVEGLEVTPAANFTY